MDTLQILAALRKFKCVGKNNYGVFASDQLPMTPIKRPAFFIANTEPHTSTGRHWIAIYIPRYGVIEFFDSFGKKPHNRHFTAFLKTHSKRGRNFFFNIKRLQSNFTLTCGHWCLMFLRKRCAGQTMKKFVGEFSDTNFCGNDKKILQMYARVMPTFSEKDIQHALQYGGQNVCNQTCKARRKKYKKKERSSVDGRH